MSTLFGQTQEANGNVPLNSSRPTWYQNSSKRVIPNHLVPKKKIGFQLSTTATKKDSEKRSQSAKSADSGQADFSIISFGNTSPHNAVSKQSDTALLSAGNANDIISLRENDEFPLYNDNEDLPPTRSLYDLNDEVIISLNKPTQHTGSFINKDPRNFVNAFTQAKDTPHITEDTQASKALQNFESAVLVFGYPEHMSSQVIAFFSEFGKILENFEASKSNKYNGEKLLKSLAPAGAFSTGEDAKSAGQAASSAPIFSGKSWVKLTYDNPSSAFDALQESGNVFNGILIGVVPYSKDAVEKLQKRKLSVSEDIGGGVPRKSAHELQTFKEGALSEPTDLQATYIKRLELKDGSEMFLKADADGKDQDKATRDGKKLGVVGTLTNFFFGFHDL